MKAKVERGGGFRGVLNYALGKEAGNACEIVGGTMSGLDPQSLAAEFRLSREARPGVARPVWHTSLALPPGDSLTSDRWAEVAADFMSGMGLADHQYVVVRHHDTDLDHVHIIASRISLNGGIWHGQFEAKKAIALTQELEERHDLTRTKGLDAPSPKKAPTRQEASFKKHGRHGPKSVLSGTPVGYTEARGARPQRPPQRAKHVLHSLTRTYLCRYMQPGTYVSETLQ